MPVSATILERVVAKASNPATILVVDDEEAIRLLLSEVLTEAGYRVLEAPDASGALTVVVSNARLDLLITDIGLPGGMDGHRLAALARQMREDLAIVLISGHGEIARDQQSGHDMHLLRKPFLMEELTSTVSHLLSGAV
ncbi:PAS/PAC sensor hybrid histidine kinase [Caballeronia temeraria]|uniref:PAS/PAC sensor hybrid histidine kinase n=1 Tax=Caballeronia temeraria TaxID=1777137 RepID=A0A158CQD4_9BURK|nr:PAS/PAC sensor hybrid histidine kinase [Caballeronia temeraria]